MSELTRIESRWLARQMRKGATKKQFHLGKEQVKAALTAPKRVPTKTHEPLPPSKLSEWWDLLSKLLKWLPPFKRT